MGGVRSIEVTRAKWDFSEAKTGRKSQARRSVRGGRERRRGQGEGRRAREEGGEGGGGREGRAPPPQVQSMRPTVCACSFCCSVAQLCRDSL